MPTFTALPPPSALRAIPALMLREVATTYGRTPGGWLWAIAEPVAAIALLSYVFSLAFEAPPVGLSFALFYATGYLPFTAFLDISTKVATALRFSRQLLSYPALARMDVLLARFILNALTHAAVAVIVILGIEVLFDTGAIWNWPRLGAALGLLVLFTAGIGILNTALFARFPVWERLWQIAMRPMFIISGIFFVIEDLPPEVATYAWYNPLLHITGLVRAAVLPGYDAPMAAPAFVALTGLVALTLGLLALRLVAKDPAHV